MRELCCDYPGLYNLKIVAMENARVCAVSIFDWVEIADHTHGLYRKEALEKILEFKTADSRDIKRLCQSSVERLRHVGWFLSGEFQTKLPEISSDKAM